MARLDCSDPEIIAALDDVRSTETDTNWYSFHFERKTLISV
jgi:hypothetical protein